MIGMRIGGISSVVALGAHCDDIAIGAGATLARLCEDNPGLRVDAIVFAGGVAAREQEERSALAALCIDAKLQITVLGLPDGRLPAHWDEVKNALTELRDRTTPDLLVAPHRHDAHQDHRTVAEITSTVFRNELVLGYEILKWDGDLTQPACYQPIPERLLETKLSVLHEHYPSQHDKDWFDADTFRGLARVRGVQCHARYAEAFHVEKWLLE
ncbi:MAG: PIG-L deacetylase family protein [Sciscionella sp.]